MESTLNVQVTVESITVKDLEDGKIYLPIVSVPSQSEKIEFVFTYDKTTKDIKPIDQVTVPAVIKPVFFEKETTKFNEVVIVSNDVVLVSEEQPDLPLVLDEIDVVYGQPLSENIKTVKVIESKTTVEFQVTVEINGKSNQIVVVKQGPKITIEGIKEIKPTVTSGEETTGQEGGETPTGEGKPINPDGETGTVVTDAIENSQVPELKDVKVIAITAEENLLNTVYTAEIITKEGKPKVVTVSVDGEGNAEIVHVTTPTSEHGQIQPVEESTTVTETDGNTGETSVVKTGEEQVEHELVDCQPVIERKLPEVR